VALSDEVAGFVRGRLGFRRREGTGRRPFSASQLLIILGPAKEFSSRTSITNSRMVNSSCEARLEVLTLCNVSQLAQRLRGLRLVKTEGVFARLLSALGSIDHVLPPRRYTLGNAQKFPVPARTVLQESSCDRFVELDPDVRCILRHAESRQEARKSLQKVLIFSHFCGVR
jgi:hypothetical protein